MTRKRGPATYKQAKGRITNGKPGRRTAARAGAGSKRAIEREKTPAKATAQQFENRQPGGGDSADILQPAEKAHLRPATGGLARLKEEARNIVKKDVKQLLKGLKEKARKGSASEVKLLLDLARLNEEKPAAKPDNESCMAMLQDLASQQEYQEPAEDGDESSNPQPGFLQTADDAAERPLEP